MKLLTQDAMRHDGPLFEFVVIDEPYSMEPWYWPRKEEVTPFCFLEFGEAVMKHVFHLFRLNGAFDPYEITNFQTNYERQGLVSNIDGEIARLHGFNREMFLERFGFSLDYLAGAHRLELAADHWHTLWSDIVEILHLIREKALEALKGGKTLSIVGI